MYRGISWCYVSLCILLYIYIYIYIYKKVKCSRYRPGVAQRVGRVPAALYLRERPGTHFTGGWVGPGTGLDGRKISSPLGFDPGPSSRQSVAIPTELPGPHILLYNQ
jgi:hypothetical protein